MSVLVAAVAAWAVLRVCGLDRRWPWRVGALGSSRPTTLAGARAQRARRPPAVQRPRPTRRSARSGCGGGARRIAEVERDLVVAIDLLHVAVSAGHSTHVAVAVVVAAATGPVTEALARAASQFDRGRRLLDALSELAPALGPAVLPLVSTLNMALTSGAPLGPALQRLADAERRRQRRRAETRARRLPVLLLAPVVGLVLPAFLVLTIVPVAVSAAGGGLGSVLGAHAPTSFVIPWSPT
ncbi:MAG: type II secretion system F family protein [Microthrixaceae bacterium]